MCISLHDTDCITVLHHDQDALSTIRQAIMESWPHGIQNEYAICGTGHAFKVIGNPFNSPESISSRNSRQMIATILHRLYNIGRRVVVSCDLGRLNDKSAVFLTRSPSHFSSAYPFVCVGLSSTDKLMIINLPTQLVETFKQTVRRNWTRGIQNESYQNGVFEIKMCGNPWESTDEQSIMAKLLLQNLVGFFYQHQYSFAVNVNLKSTADSLFFRHDPDLPAGSFPQLCTISLNRTDRLRILCAPEPIITIIRGVIQSVWSPGTIQNEKDHHGSWEFKLSGNPWHSSKGESVMARYLILKILEAMMVQGWHNIAAIDISRRLSDKSVLIFKKGEPKCCPVMCLSLTDSDKLRLINAPHELDDTFKEIVLSRWMNGIQEEKIMNLSFGGVRQLKLRGCPWNGGINNDTCHMRSFLCNVIEAYAARGWRVLMAGDVSAKYESNCCCEPDYPIDVHSFWFVCDGMQLSSPPTAHYPTSGYGIMPSPNAENPPTAPYPPTTGYGLHPNPNPNISPHEPPPTYGQAVGWEAGRN
ncbi:uncharacterized protein LOC124434494 [Xenia sp. Carnegie-2017]|uniref:uncharacterized protein LOC124434494 n=1 Tax=Xenia sp. Carnegie-2017 TaxID=2897299 RepID=UPI001F045C25|nr:uncharacterized protein LOC124434494 [Xenia sp. Carnegie-2017]